MASNNSGNDDWMSSNTKDGIAIVLLAIALGGVLWFCVTNKRRRMRQTAVNRNGIMLVQQPPALAFRKESDPWLHAPPSLDQSLLISKGVCDPPTYPASTYHLYDRNAPSPPPAYYSSSSNPTTPEKSEFPMNPNATSPISSPSSTTFPPLRNAHPEVEGENVEGGRPGNVYTRWLGQGTGRRDPTHASFV
ncbi:hypothetical protein JAAARDRAFT_33055 [Jaapia argillacea MUCL 33604]|uniref:Uncharacterized protein n=1 Tax=Jaapia argillacea MUCL 33604 TaxID=933084 RepID=A0A067PXS3_9AGAM|nr:hypothetical protein JAAARDRAFT_33055 [Jaapia argillacea MUCL 33604]